MLERNQIDIPDTVEKCVRTPAAFSVASARRDERELNLVLVARLNSW